MRCFLFYMVLVVTCVCHVTAQHIVIDVSSLEAVTDHAVNFEKKEGANSRFSWGMDVGSCIDMTGSDMSALDINAYFGYSGPYVRFAGVGAGIDMMVSSSSNAYPVYALFRTDFSPSPQLCFLELRGGASFSNIESYPMQTTPFGSIGFGVTLAKGKKFSSHIVLSYNYTKLDDVRLAEDQGIIRVHDLQYAAIRIGVAF